MWSIKSGYLNMVESYRVRTILKYKEKLKSKVLN